MTTETYSIGERVLCQYEGQFYDAKVVEVEREEGDIAYVVHYQGWNKRFDERISGSDVYIRILRFTTDNIEATRAVIKKQRPEKIEEKKVNPGGGGDLVANGVTEVRKRNRLAKRDGLKKQLEGSTGLNLPSRGQKISRKRLQPGRDAGSEAESREHVARKASRLTSGDASKLGTARNSISERTATEYLEVELENGDTKSRQHGNPVAVESASFDGVEMQVPDGIREVSLVENGEQGITGRRDLPGGCSAVEVVESWLKALGAPPAPGQDEIAVPSSSLGRPTSNSLLLFLPARNGDNAKLKGELGFAAGKTGIQVHYVTVTDENEGFTRGKKKSRESNVTVMNAADALKMFGVEEKELPTARFITSVGFTSNFTVDNVVKFAEDCAAGIALHSTNFMKADIKDSGPVKILTMKKYDEVMSNIKKNVLVGFCLPQSEGGKKMVELFNKLGERYADDESMIIAIADEEVINARIFLGRPMSKAQLFPAGSRKVMDYEGELELEELIKFIGVNCKVEGATTPVSKGKRKKYKAQ